ncbi:hypothetical protein QBC33DRAFT_288712 [Phialemonium atrogriseum]|uniref:Uncharacterized protein n=1 Tax=Phialemonium atrogriseum TaxID=1093897 RepID=A0AAJ0BSK3_9PEZI|nr:uncharacterized protein QBC33DRAFT_288712 [Phialemonium atrogriseum]KAK1762262.1 hypothetical protein QBC33DRAFT_288712 [Phialemonium atrogriseum]
MGKTKITKSLDNQLCWRGVFSYRYSVSLFPSFSSFFSFLPLLFPPLFLVSLALALTNAVTNTRNRQVGLKYDLWLFFFFFFFFFEGGQGRDILIRSRQFEDYGIHIKDWEAHCLLFEVGKERFLLRPVYQLQNAF